MVFVKLFQEGVIQNLVTVDLPSNNLFRVVEHTDQLEAQLFKRHMPGDSLAQITGADQDAWVMLLDTQDLFDFLTELEDVITISLLPKTAKTVKILADL